MTHSLAWCLVTTVALVSVVGGFGGIGPSGHVGVRPTLGHDPGLQPVAVRADVSPALNISPGLGPVRTLVTFSGTGFAANSPTNVYLALLPPGSPSGDGGKITCSNTTTSTGAFNCAGIVPDLTAGGLTFEAIDGASNSATAVFTVETQLTVSPRTGGPGTGLRFDGSGFGGIYDYINPDEYTVTNSTGALACPIGVTGESIDDWGTFNCTGTVPAGTVNGTYRFLAQDTDGYFAYTTFVVGHTFAVTFEAVGLPSGSTWSVTAASLQQTNTTLGSRGTIVFQEPSGPLTFSITSPSGYGVASIAGPGSPSQTGATVSGPVVWKVTFGKLGTLFFNETRVGYQLYPDASWTVTLTAGPSHGGPPGQSTSGTGTSISFSVPAGALYKFTVSGPSAYKVVPRSGGVNLPRSRSSLTMLERFTLETSAVRFAETGLPRNTAWNVTIRAGPVEETYPLQLGPTSKSTIITRLPTGTYTYYAVSGTTTVGGTFSVVYPTPATVTVAGL